MPATTPVYGIPYQELGDAPHGPNLGSQGFLEVEVELQRMDTVPTVNTYIADATWTKPANAKYLEIEGQAPGGPGGGAQNPAAGQQSAGAGGSAGNYSKTVIAASAVGATVAVTVSPPGTALSGGVGNNSGNVSFGTHCVANGGQAGGVIAAGNTNAGFIGAAPPSLAGSAGQIQDVGEGGGFAKREILDGAVLTITSGSGGNSPNGGGGRARENLGAGLDGGQYGAGGGGALATPGGGRQTRNRG